MDEERFLKFLGDIEMSLSLYQRMLAVPSTQRALLRGSFHVGEVGEKTLSLCHGTLTGLKSFERVSGDKTNHHGGVRSEHIRRDCLSYLSDWNFEVFFVSYVYNAECPNILVLCEDFQINSGSASYTLKYISSLQYHSDHHNSKPPFDPSGYNWTGTGTGTGPFKINSNNFLIPGLDPCSDHC